MTFIAQEELSCALRSLRRHPFSSLLITIMLALGIGGNAIAFSWIDTLLLQPLPFEDPELLVFLDETAPEWNLESTAIHYADFDSWRRSQHTFEAMAVLRGQDFSLSGRDRPEHVEGALVTHDLLDVLELRPVLGRFFDETVDRAGGPNVLLLGHALWQRRFGGRLDVLKEVVHLDGEPYTVVGVLPPEAGFALDADLWIPLRADPTRWQGYSLAGLGRLKRGVDRAEAEADLRAIQRRRIEAGEADEDVLPIVGSLRERYVRKAKPYALALWATVAFVLLIACGNVTCLLLVHTLTRRREFGIRSALGASRPRLLRQVFAECFLLALLGGGVGWGLAWAGLRSLLVATGQGIPFWAVPELDGRVFAFCSALCLGVTVLCGIVTSLRITGKPVLALLGTAGEASLDHRRHRLLRMLIVAEIALALMLLFGTGLLLRSFFELRAVDPGFRSEKVLTFRLNLPARHYDRSRSRQFFQELRKNLDSLPGVVSASSVSLLPLTGHSGSFLSAENPVRPDPEGRTPVILHRVAAPGYFKTMGVTVLRGRPFDEQDGRHSETPVVIINESFAEHFWPGRDPIGERVRYHRDVGSRWMTVVGLARDVLHYGLDQAPRPGVYVPMEQMPLGAMTMVLRTHVDPRLLMEAIRSLVMEMDPQLPVFQVRTMQERLEESLLARRLIGELATIFTGVALLMALGGIYGVTSYVVRQRTREIGLRIALGARPGQVRRLVLGSGGRLVVAGVGTGFVASMGLVRGLQSLLYGVEVSDTWILGLSVLSLVAVALLGILLPALRVSGVEPARVLRK